MTKHTASSQRLPKPRLTAGLTAAIGAACFASAAAPHFAAAQSGTIEEIVVFGRDINLVGRADAASEGSVSGADLLIRPMLKVGELLESMPGMVAVQHSGSGKANQYFLRGFNLDHGTDYSAHLDGVPLNLRSHGHGQGYLDVNGLIPETIDSIDYRKGPYRADLGDFSMAGASFINTLDRLERSFVSAETGQHGWRRLAGGMSEEVREGTLTMAGEYKQFDGPWGQPENLEHVAVWGKYTQPTRFGRMLVSLSGYDASWQPTEQIPERAAGSSVCPDSFCTLDPSAAGSTRRWVLNSRLSGSDWEAGLWSQYYDWEMSSNPTYDFQLGQADKRWMLGGSANKDLINSTSWQLKVGGEFRHDDASQVKLDHLEQGQFLESISDNAITESSLGLYGEAVWSATDRLRLIAGLRGDYYRFDVDAFNDASFAGKVDDSRASPKLALAYAASRDVELYANWGRGFHSNDARGVVNNSDPVPGLSPGIGYELGTRAA
ncbi:MAG TPA: TonB-dependent receptor, partial [Pseudomonadaceae bacterium]|nr:TonB-dependent receptor [Pseudomonadaceae bacterium]